MEEKRCESCMKMTARPVCEHCGYPQNKQNETHQLPVGTVLGERYQVGKVLGQGGFGITYLGWDKEAEEKVAVKEFYPSSTVNRDCGQTKFIHCNTTQMEPHYQMSRERFLREAKALARLKDIPEIVGIKDFLEENNTAYIIMEYVQGMDLAHYIQRRGGRLNVDETFRILKPVMEALAKVHKLGLVHRDISPDNIILHPMGGAKLLDFGAVRAVENADTEKSLTKSTEAILKHGFAPIEQYQTRGSLGPWTDEYAMCATVYYCLTGKIIEDATTRMAEEIDPDWSGIPGLTDEQIAALSKGMAVRAKNRFPGMDALIEALFPQPEPEPEPAPQPEPVPVPVPQPGPQEPPKPKKQPKPKAPKDPKKKNKAPLIAVACVAGILLVAGLLASMFLTWRDPSDPPGPLIQADEPDPTGQTAPAHIGPDALPEETEGPTQATQPPVLTPDDIPDEMHSPNGRYQIAFIADIGPLKDYSFNQYTYDGVKMYAAQNGKTYKYYQPADSYWASDDDRFAAMQLACENGAEVIVAAGFMQAGALEAAAQAYPNVNFVFIDGWNMGYDNVIPIYFHEEQSGFLAGYAAVMEGYTKLGFCGGGGGNNPACCRYGNGFAQGAAAAAKKLGVAVELNYSWSFGLTFSASPELQALVEGWYSNGTEVVFVCGGSMFQSVDAAANNMGGLVIGVDTDQSYISPNVITSALKRLDNAAYWALEQYFAGSLSNSEGTDGLLGANEGAVDLPTKTWSFEFWTVEDHLALLEDLASGSITVSSDPVTYPSDTAELDVIPFN